MTLNLSIPEQTELKPKITVFGVGGAGGNAVNNMIDKALDGVDFVVANTDAQALQQNKSPEKVQMGIRVTEGLGAGARPAVGSAAAEESIEQIVDHLAGSHMCFITAGMGGGTGTGAAPIIAQAARELGILTVGVVTKPFQFEGGKRMRQAEDGVDALQKVVDTLIIIPNQNLFRLANEKTTFTEAFSMADDVLYQGVKGVTDLMVRPGLINLDFADVRAVMDEMGKAMMGTGEATGENRAIEAAEKAIANPLLDEISLQGARGVLINITGGDDLTLFELDEAANRIRQEVDPEANIIVGSTMDPELDNGVMRVSVVATGIDAVVNTDEIPVPRRRLSEPLPVFQEQPEPAAVEQSAPVAETQEPSFFDAPAAAPAPQAPAAEEVAQNTFFDSMQRDVATAAEAPAMRPAPAPHAAQQENVPAPAYQPAAPTEALIHEDDFADQSFVAPQAPAPGTPSAETLARLQAAVGKAPAQQGVGAAAPAPRPAAVAPQQPAPEPAAEDRTGRFGINSLIGRMTGNGQQAAPAPAPTAAAHPMRSEPTMHVYEAEADADSDQDRIEIPAFLRRQAN
ncbi:MAG: cell division protein FtsZ [Halocynthiibacter sp.]